MPRMFQFFGRRPRSGALPERMTSFSVIIPIGRPLEAERSVRSVLEQQTARELEILLVAASVIELDDPRVRTIVVPDRNPARRRNAAAREARGEILAFIDDDAYARPTWIEAAAAIFESRTEVLAAGGPDPAPRDSTLADLISDNLLATPFIGSSVSAHESRRGEWIVRQPHDVALVNLFVRRTAFENESGFDESIGYIGEDSALLRKLMGKGVVLYSDSVVVEHRRRAFPGPYLSQRFRYRRKSGRMFVERGTGRGDAKLWALLIAGLGFPILVFLAPSAALVLLVVYYVLTLALSWRPSRLPRPIRPLVPFAFLAHHAAYFAGLVVGIGEAVLKGGASREAS